MGNENAESQLEERSAELSSAGDPLLADLAGKLQAKASE